MGWEPGPDTRGVIKQLGSDNVTGDGSAVELGTIDFPAGASQVTSWALAGAATNVDSFALSLDPAPDSYYSSGAAAGAAAGIGTPSASLYGDAVVAYANATTVTVSVTVETSDPEDVATVEAAYLITGVRVA